MKIVNESQEKHLNIIKEGLKEFQALIDAPDCDVKLLKLLSQYTDEQQGLLPRRLKQFDSSIMTVVAMGMLKAGKSTLVNLLARNKLASPVGYGRDTTLRPALIRMAEEGEDVGEGYIYIFADISDSDKRDHAFGVLMDCMRGIKPKGALPKYKRKRLTDKDLNEALCTEPPGELLDKEPLLIVVELPYNKDCEILKDNRMLLDMPGLDSDQSAIISRYESIISECDLMIFVQSSMAPLNIEATRMLQSILRKRHNTSCYIVQNAMRARYWRTEAVQVEEQRKQSAGALRRLEDAIREARGNNSEQFTRPAARTVNLGLAYDGIFTPGEQLAKAPHCLTDGTAISKENLWEKSQFANLEEDLLSALQADGVRGRFTHCRTELAQILSAARTDLQESLDEESGHLTEKMQELSGLSSGLAKVEELLNESATCDLNAAITIDTPPKFTLLRSTARERAGIGPNDNKVFYGTARKYLQEYEKLCYEASEKFLAMDISVAHIRVPSKKDEQHGLSGTNFCNNQLDEAYKRLAKAEIEGIKPTLLESVIVGKDERLYIRAESYGGMERYINSIESREVLTNEERAGILNKDDDGLTGRPDAPTPVRRDPFGWNLPWARISLKGGTVELYETECTEKCLLAISRIVNEKIKTILPGIIRKGIFRGAENYLQKLQANINTLREECEVIQLGIRRRKALVSKLSEFIDRIDIIE